MAVGRGVQCPTKLEYARIWDWGAGPWVSRCAGLIREFRGRSGRVNGRRGGIWRVPHEGCGGPDGAGVEGNAGQRCGKVGEYYRHFMCPEPGLKRW